MAASRLSLSLLLLLSVAALSSLSPAAAQDCPPDDYCRPSSGAAVCSGVGDCVCGQCDCRREELSGQYCECDDSRCPVTPSVQDVCGGPGRGSCVCGRCMCAPGWTGAACDCSMSTDSCKEPGSDRVCSGKGQCKCGRCECYGYGGEAYSGEFCETCPTCVGKCETYRDCVECLAFNSGPLAAQCQTACSQVTVQLEDQPKVSAPGERLCSFYTSEGCRFNFVYSSGGRLRVESQVDCPPPPNGVLKPVQAATDQRGGGDDSSGGEGGDGGSSGGAASGVASLGVLLVALTTAICSR